MIPYRCFSPFLVSYDDTVIKSIYIKSDMLTIQDKYKVKIVFFLVDIKGCDIILERPWHEKKNAFLVVEENKYIFHDNGI